MNEAILTAAATYKIEPQAQKIMNALTSLQTGTEEEHRYALSQHCNFGPEEVDSILRQLESFGYISLNLFEIAELAGIPKVVITTAQDIYQERQRMATSKQTVFFPLSTSTSALSSRPSSGSTSSSSSSSAAPSLSSTVVAASSAVDGVPSSPTATSTSTSTTTAPATSLQGRRSSLSQQRNIRAMPHCFREVCGQVDAGVITLKRVTGHLSRICVAKQAYVKKLQESQPDPLRKGEDSMTLCFEGWAGFCEVMNNARQLEIDWIRQVTEDVVNPLTELTRDLEYRRKAVVEDYAKLRKDVQKAGAVVSKTKANCTKLLDAMKTAQEEAKQNATGGTRPASKSTTGSSGGLFSKISKAYSSTVWGTLDDMKIKAGPLVQSYEEAIAQANVLSAKMDTEDLPNLLQRLQKIEQDRLQAMQKYMGVLAGVESARIPSAQDASQLFSSKALEMNTTEDFNAFIDATLNSKGPWSGGDLYRYELPATLEEIQKGQLGGKTLFGVTLEQTMEVRKDGDVPLIVTTLVRAVRELEGTKQEGIFRLSPNKEEMIALRKQIDSGSYEVKTTDPHVPAALLKEWLRELAEPLIPADLYSVAVDMAKVENIEPSNSLSVYRQLPELNKNVLKRILSLIFEVASNSEVTMMTLPNLAIVFSPCLLRNPSEDPVEWLGNSKYETRFVVFLFKALQEEAEKTA